MEELQRICERLLRDSNSLSVLLVDRNGEELARAGDIEALDLLPIASLLADDTVEIRAIAKSLAEGKLSSTGEKIDIHVSRVAELAVLVILFGTKTSWGLVRLRASKATFDLRRALERGPTGSGGSSGATALLDD